MSNVNIRIRDEDELSSLPNREERLDELGNYSYRNRYQDRQERFLDIELEKRKWKNRRLMAWISLIMMIVVTLLLLFGAIPDTRLKAIADPITWFYFAMASVIGAYMGFTTWANKGR